MVHQSLSDQNLQNKADFFFKKREFPKLLEFDNVPEDKDIRISFSYSPCHGRTFISRKRNSCF